MHAMKKTRALARWRASGLVVGLVAGLIFAVAVPVSAHQYGSTSGNHHEHDGISDYTYLPSPWPSGWNGYYIYLSPAHHWVGWKWGCSETKAGSSSGGYYVEDLNMPQVAYEAASGAYTDLTDRGYYVRVGRADPDENVIRGNGWTSNYSHTRYIVLHSNGNSLDGKLCNGGATGTRTIYYPGSTNGQDLANELLYTLGPQSPGSDATYTETWYELAHTIMAAAYVEANFHDERAGEIWLARDYEEWAWKIGWAVDRHLGYP
jgi:hypothetical protein